MTDTCNSPYLAAVMLNGASNVASSFFIVVMSNVRSRQLLVASCTAHTQHTQAEIYAQHLTERRDGSRANVASSFFIVVMSNVRSKQLLVASCTQSTQHLK